MKKIFGILMVGGLLFMNNIYVFGATCPDGQIIINGKCGELTDNQSQIIKKCGENGGVRNYFDGVCDAGLSNANMTEGIEMSSECLNNGQCKFKIYDLLKIRKSVETEGADSTSPDIFVQDIVLAATFFIGTVVTIAIIVSGLMFIFAGATGKDPSKAKSGLINSLIGLLIVISSYSIIRLVQYIAKGF